jgi:hypothetical protein
MAGRDGNNRGAPDEYNLPHFGVSNKKEPNSNSQNRNNDDIYMNNQGLEDINTDNSQLEGDRLGINIKTNPNLDNTFKNESNLADDSIFGGKLN